MLWSAEYNPMRADAILAYVNDAGTTPALCAVLNTCQRPDQSDDMAGFAAVARLVKAGKIHRVQANERRSEDALLSLAEARQIGILPRGD